MVDKTQNDKAHQDNTSCASSVSNSGTENKTFEEILLEEKSKLKEPSLDDLIPGATWYVGNVDLAPLSPGVIRVHDAVSYWLNKEGIKLKSDEDGLLLIYIMSRATKENRMELFKDAREPNLLFQKFVDWHFEQNSETVMRLLGHINKEVEKLNQAIALTDEGETEEQSLKKKD